MEAIFFPGSRQTKDYLHRTSNELSLPSNKSFGFAVSD
jgi:hypothetical protein